MVTPMVICGLGANRSIRVQRQYDSLAKYTSSGNLLISECCTHGCYNVRIAMLVCCNHVHITFNEYSNIKLSNFG